MKHIKEIELPVKIMAAPTLEFEEFEHIDDEGNKVYTAGAYKFLPLQFETDENTLKYILNQGKANYKIKVGDNEWLLENVIVTDNQYLNYENARQLNV